MLNESVISAEDQLQADPMEFGNTCDSAGSALPSGWRAFLNCVPLKFTCGSPNPVKWCLKLESLGDN